MIVKNIDNVRVCFECNQALSPNPDDWVVKVATIKRRPVPVAYCSKCAKGKEVCKLTLRQREKRYLEGLVKIEKSHRSREEKMEMWKELSESLGLWGEISGDWIINPQTGVEWRLKKAA